MHSSSIDPELLAAGAELRQEWRADEEMWTRAAETRWRRSRTLADVACALASRGDAVVVHALGITLVGQIAAVGRDVLVLTTADGVIDVVTGAVTLVRVTARGAGHGRRPPLVSLRARLVEREESRVRTLVAAATSSATGTLRVGAEHLEVDDAGTAIFVPFTAIAFVRDAPR